MAVSFITTVSETDWDTTTKGWRCNALVIPDVVVDAVFVNGEQVDPAFYDVKPSYRVIRWVRGEQPAQAGISISVPDNLRTKEQSEELSRRWKIAAILLPFLATILSGYIGYLTATRKQTSDQHTTSNNSIIQKERKDLGDLPIAEMLTPPTWVKDLQRSLQADGAKRQAIMITKPVIVKIGSASKPLRWIISSTPGFTITGIAFQQSSSNDSFKSLSVVMQKPTEFSWDVPAANEETRLIAVVRIEWTKGIEPSNILNAIQSKVDNKG